MMRISRIDAGSWVLGICATTIGAGIVIGSDLLLHRKLQSERPVLPDLEKAFVPASVNTAGAQDQVPAQPPVPEVEQAQSISTPSTENEPAAPSLAPAPDIEVVQWRFGGRPGDAPNQPPQGDIVAGRPLYLWMTLNGTQAAVDAMRSGHPPKIQVHWVREGSNGAPNLTTELPIGRAGLADTFEQQVRRKGFFEWHSWARKVTLPRGTWTISLTYPDGRPLPCAPAAEPCRFKIEVG